MPSPLAHASVVFLAGPAIPVTRPGRVLPPAGWSAAIVLMLCLPDIDFLLGRVTGLEVLGHGGALHSLLFGVVAGVVFGAAASLATGRRAGADFARWVLIGTACVWSHLAMDFFTRGGGVMLFWPLWNERIGSPWPLFYGAHHSQPFAFHLHAITLSTELAFAAVLWLLARRRARTP